MLHNILLTLSLLVCLTMTKTCDTPSATPGNAETGCQTDEPVSNQSATNNAAASQQEEKAKGEKSGVRISYEMPAERNGEMILSHTGFTISYNKANNTPDWAAWHLTSNHCDGDVERSTKFWADPDIPRPYRVEYYEYKGSGYDRGHMCPAGDMKWSEKAMHDCFYMSNMCPQTSELNSGAWNKLEMKCREWAMKEGSLYIVCGPIYSKSDRETIGIEHAIRVPGRFFKAVLSMRKGHEKAVAFIFRNDDSSQSYKSAATTVDEVERVTGLDLFHNLDDKTEERVEAQCDIKAFNSSTCL